MIKILEVEKEIIEEAEEITDYDYKSEITEDNYTDTNTIMKIIEDLIVEYKKLEEEKEELEYRLENDYEPKKFDAYYEYGISESDFH